MVLEKVWKIITSILDMLQSWLNCQFLGLDVNISNILQPQNTPWATTGLIGGGGPQLSIFSLPSFSYASNQHYGHSIRLQSCIIIAMYWASDTICCVVSSFDFDNLWGWIRSLDPHRGIATGPKGPLDPLVVRSEGFACCARFASQKFRKFQHGISEKQNKTKMLTKALSLTMQVVNFSIWLRHLVCRCWAEKTSCAFGPWIWIQSETSDESL